MNSPVLMADVLMCVASVMEPKTVQRGRMKLTVGVCHQKRASFSKCFLSFLHWPNG